jgi:hypothetical protein
MKVVTERGRAAKQYAGGEGVAVGEEKRARGRRRGEGTWRLLHGAAGWRLKSEGEMTNAI